MHQNILAKHSGRILVIGLGSVGQAIIPLLLRHIDCFPDNITVLELGEHEELFNTRWADTDVFYVKEKIVKENLNRVLSTYLEPGDFLINVSLNIDGIEIVRWCLEHDVMYIDTSIERWEDQQDEVIPNLADRTLYAAHAKIREMAKAYPLASTVIVTHGANPGLVTHFTKAALLDISENLNLRIEEPSSKEEWAQLMYLTGTKVVHIAERDTQVINIPKKKNEFVNTWSCEGFWAESRACSELGFGHHEKTLPLNAEEHKDGPKNAIYLKQPGLATLVKSWVPLGGTINGFLVQHSEAVTISEYFTAYNNEGEVLFRPTVHYAYQPADMALESIHELRGRELEIQPSLRIAKDEIISGIDELGVLLMGGDYTSWWYGSQLGIDEARELVPHENATSLQVAGSILGAMVWALKNPKQGYCEPEDLPWREVLDIAKLYLGPMASVQSDWTPLQNRSKLFDLNLDETDPWQFQNFLVTY